jgi:hypothetical protein
MLATHIEESGILFAVLRASGQSSVHDFDLAPAFFPRGLGTYFGTRQGLSALSALGPEASFRAKTLRGLKGGFRRRTKESAGLECPEHWAGCSVGEIQLDKLTVCPVRCWPRQIPESARLRSSSLFQIFQSPLSISTREGDKKAVENEAFT